MVWGLYRFAAHFPSASVVTPSHAASRIETAEPLVWDFNEKKITWDLVRGQLGFRPGQLVVKGDGATPVIISPTNPVIDWSRYESIRIRMIAEAGSEIKIKLGDLELKQPLAPPMQWQVYRFDLKLNESSYTRPMAIMPTDDLNAPVAIDSIELVPRKATLTAPAGVTNVNKREDYREAIFARAPSTLTYEVSVPKNGVLHFAMGVSSKAPVVFRILAGPSNAELFSAKLDNPEVWQDGSVDLSAYGGATQKLVFRTDSEISGATGFWANPVMTSRTPKSRPNVLLYVVCTLRPDHTSLYGYGRETTPFLKRLGQSAVVFEDSQAQASWTKPSVSSLLTSLNAYTHGLVNDSDVIPKGAATLAEQLRKTGYVTASIVANPFAGHTSGLERGFDYMMEYPVVQRFRTDTVDRGTDSAAVNRAVMPWLEHHREEPFFLFVQSTDPHAPYRPPADFEARFANPSDTPQFNKDYGSLRDIRAYGGGATVSRAEIRARGIDPDSYIKKAVDRYDAEIAHNDRSIELLLGKLKDLGVLDNTLVIVASDHGEEFWEHGFGAHGHSLYSELIHTVLLMWNPRLLPEARRISEPVQLIDVMPTVLELVGAQQPESLEGQSLVPLLRGGKFSRSRPVMATKLALPKAKPDGGVPENSTDTFARIDARWKLIYRPQGPRAKLKELELYDRQTDRRDRNDVALQNGDLAHTLKTEVTQWMEREKQVRTQLGSGGQRKIDPATLERLRSLGYVGGKK